MTGSAFHDRRRKLDLLQALRPQKKTPPPQTGEVYIKCTDCLADHAQAALAENLYLCERCGAHLRMPATARLMAVLDAGSFGERFGRIKGGDPLVFPGYAQKLADARAQTGLADACLCATGTIGGHKAVLCALEPAFLMGSMGTAVGEKITQAAEYARRSKLPLIIFSASGGARMQEGILSLMQMAKTAAAIARLGDSGGLYISCITHPTTGGVTASFASLGDIILAEPGAVFGFAGRRVIEQTIGERLPPGFQSSEFARQHGFVDALVHRCDLPATLARLLALHGR